jgi:hypothetical protein
MRTLIWVLMGIIMVFIFWPSGEKAEIPLTPQRSSVVSPTPDSVASPGTLPSSDSSFPVVSFPESKPMVLSQPRSSSVRRPGQVFEPVTTVDSPFFIPSSAPTHHLNSTSQPPHLAGDPPVMRRRR